MQDASDSAEPLLTGGRPRRAVGAAAGAGVCALLTITTILLWPRQAEPTVDADAAKQPARLTIRNGCARSDLWIAGFAVAAPIFDGDVKLAAGKSIEVTPTSHRPRAPGRRRRAHRRRTRVPRGRMHSPPHVT